MSKVSGPQGEIEAISDIRTELTGSGIGLIHLNRPTQRNALRNRMLSEIADTLDDWQAQPEIRCVVITGNESCFAAGADLNEMAQHGAIGLLKDPRPSYWKRIREFTKPLLASVNGFCLGGGFELAMHADIVIAGRDARFGQPEINLGIMPGAGGTQRVVRDCGKSLAMKLALSGEFIDAESALRAGLVAEVTEPDQCLERTLELAARMATKAPLALQLAKASVLRAYETALAQGLEAERQAFLLLAASEDRQEGINAFLEKRKPEFSGN